MALQPQGVQRYHQRVLHQDVADGAAAPRSYGSRRRRIRPSLKPAPPRTPAGPPPAWDAASEPPARSPTRYWRPPEQASAVDATCACEQPAPGPDPNHVFCFLPICSQHRANRKALRFFFLIVIHSLPSPRFLKQVSCSQGWPRTHSRTQADLELLILLLQPHNCWDCKCKPHLPSPLSTGQL